MSNELSYQWLFRKNPALSVSLNQDGYVVDASDAFLARFGLRIMSGVLLAVALVSFAGSAWAVTNGAESAAFFLLPTRAWELFTGDRESLIVSHEAEDAVEEAAAKQAQEG